MLSSPQQRWAKYGQCESFLGTGRQTPEKRLRLLKSVLHVKAMQAEDRGQP